MTIGMLVLICQRFRLDGVEWAFQSLPIYDNKEACFSGLYFSMNIWHFDIYQAILIIPFSSMNYIFGKEMGPSFNILLKSTFSQVLLVIILIKKVQEHLFLRAFLWSTWIICLKSGKDVGIQGIQWGAGLQLCEMSAFVPLRSLDTKNKLSWNLGAYTWILKLSTQLILSWWEISAIIGS